MKHKYKIYYVEKKENYIMNVNELVLKFKEQKVMNTKLQPNAIEDFIKTNIEIKTYIPFMNKKQIAEMVINQNMNEEHGITRVESTGQFIGFIMAMITSHTNLEVNLDNPIESYDLLSEAGLLELIIAQFQKDYSECEAILKMVAADALADNNLNAVVARFLDGILDKLDGVGDGLKNMIEGIDLKNILGMDFTNEDLSQLKGFLNKYTN